MQSHQHSELIEEIDRLISAYLDARDKVEPRMVDVTQIDADEFLEHGAYPPSDPRSESAAALMEIAGRLNTDGGNARLKAVLDAYRSRYGAKRAATLNARWQYLAEQ